ncbi:MAG: hypothetical protein ACUVST_12215 [Anaerolineae bacterium]
MVGLIFGLLVLGWLAATALPVFLHARPHVGSRQAASWALRSLVYPSRYWWGERLLFLSGEEWERLLQRELARWRLSTPDAVHCPLCGREMPHALEVGPSGEVQVRRPAECATCGFRLDACRHCIHFRPARAAGGGDLGGWGGGEDYTTGSCEVYREWRPISEVCPPSVAREMAKRGWDGLVTGKRIVDSYVPLEECTRFALDLTRLRRTGCKDLGARHRGVLAAWWARQKRPTEEGPTPEAGPSGEGEWLF